MQHFLSTLDCSAQEINQLLEQALYFKRGSKSGALSGKTVALIFLNPSMRTRSSMQIAVAQLGGSTVVIEPGSGAWPLEWRHGQTMDGLAEEHVSEVAGVLSQYCDAIAVRAFPSFKNWEEDKQDGLINAFARHACVPVINMETIVHPLQALAMMMTIKETLGKTQNKKFLLTWTWHPKPLNTAVANTALVAAAQMGFDVELLVPTDEYLLDEQFMQSASAAAEQSGGSLKVTTDIGQGYADADFVYAKSWGALNLVGDPVSEQALREPFRHFIVDQQKMSRTNHARFSHCLPLRRNVKATDEVMDADYCVAMQEAGNRLHVQKAVLQNLIGFSQEVAA